MLALVPFLLLLLKLWLDLVLVKTLGRAAPFLAAEKLCLLAEALF